MLYTGVRRRDEEDSQCAWTVWWLLIADGVITSPDHPVHRLVFYGSMGRVKPRLSTTHGARGVVGWASSLADLPTRDPIPRQFSMLLTGAGIHYWLAMVRCQGIRCGLYSERGTEWSKYLNRGEI